MANLSPREDYIAAIRAVSVFRDLADQHVQFLANRCQERRYRSRQTIFQQGDPCTTFSIVMSGAITASFLSADGKEVILSELPAASVAGDMELLSGSPYLTNGVANGSTRILAIGKQEFESLLEEPAFTRALLEAICKRLQHSLDFAEGLSIHTLETRLARLLMSMSKAHGRKVDGGVLIDRKISQMQIGQMVNASRPRVNVQLQSWKNGNVIRLAGKKITILDEGMLQNISRPMEDFD